MDSRLLSNGQFISDINSREEAWAFIKEFSGRQLKLRINLTEEDGENFMYYGDEDIMVDRTACEMQELYYNWVPQMPMLKDIIEIVIADISEPDACSDENFMDRFSTEIDDAIRALDLSKDDYRVTIELLEDLGRDMYNYLSYAIANTKIVSDECVWEYLKCGEARMTNDKLYITLTIYEEYIRELDYLDERPSVDFIEVTNEIRKLFDKTISHAREREVYHRGRDGGLVSRLLT